MVYQRLLNTYYRFPKTKKKVRTCDKIKLDIHFNAVPIEPEHAGRIGRIQLMGQLFLGDHQDMNRERDSAQATTENNDP